MSGDINGRKLLAHKDEQEETNCRHFVNDGKPSASCSGGEANIFETRKQEEPGNPPLPVVLETGGFTHADDGLSHRRQDEEVGGKAES